MRKILLIGTALGGLWIAEPAVGQTPPADGCDRTTGTPVPPDIADCGPVLAILEPPSDADASSGVFPVGMSDDGRTIFSDNVTGSFPGFFGLYRWRDGEPERINATNTQVTLDVSGDGQAFGGFSVSNDSLSTYQATYWTAATGFRFIARPGEQDLSTAVGAINGDASQFVVNVSNGSTISPTLGQQWDGRGGQVYLWSPTAGYRPILTPGVLTGSALPVESFAGTAISRDATVVAGNYLTCVYTCSTQNIRGAFRWTESGGAEALPFLSNATYGNTFARNSFAADISGDGSTIVGGSADADGNGQAVYWRGSQIVGLGFVPGLVVAEHNTFANAVNADGSVIVGGTMTRDFGILRSSEFGVAWRWTAATGMQDLNVLAATSGLSLNGWRLTEGLDVTANGNAVLGNAYNASLDRFRPFLLSIISLGQTGTATTRLLVEIRLPDVTQQSIVNQTLAARVQGTLDGVQLFDRTTPGAIGDAAGQASLLDARAAIQLAAGLRRITISAPVLTGVDTVTSNPRTATTDEIIAVQTLLASVTTSGPASVATGDLGTCTTPAQNGIAPTGCSLAGTPVAVGAGDSLINSYTSTINTLQRTIVTSVDQQQTSNYLVAGIAGNQFGTAHALVGPAAFAANDRLLAQLLKRGSSGAGAMQIANSSAPKRDTMALGGNDRGIAMFAGGYARWGSTGGDTALAIARVENDARGFVLGLEKQWESARLGIAVDHGAADHHVRDPLFAERLDARLTQFALYGGWSGGSLSLAGALTTGFGKAKTDIASPTGPARAARDLSSWGIGAQAGYDLIAGDRHALNLVAGLRHGSARLKRFTETGGLTPLSGLARTVTRTRLFAGVEGSTRFGGKANAITPSAYIRFARDSGDRDGVADLVFASNPNGPALQAFGPGTGRYVAETGAAIDAQINDHIIIRAAYDANFKSNAKAHAINATLTIRL